MLDRLMPYAKAIMAGAVAFTGATAVGFADEVMTTGEWWTAAASGIAALAATFGIRNTPKPPTRVDQGRIDAMGDR